MNIQIKNRLDYSVIFEGEFETLLLAVEESVRKSANLRSADLCGANLRSANLVGANLRSADLCGANLSSIRSDLFDVLLLAPGEVAGLRAALADGRVNGSVYTGECACLVGTIANVRGCDYKSLGALKPDANRPAEAWFMDIREGDTPDKSSVVQITIGWIDEFLALAAALRAEATHAV